MTAESPIRAVFQVEVQDMTRAIGFYRDGLGAEVSGTSGDFCIAKFGSTEVCLELSGSGGVTDSGLALEVSDLAQACAAAEAAGGRVFRPEDKPWLAIITDTEGNRVCVVGEGGCFFHPAGVVEPGAEASAE